MNIKGFILFVCCGIFCGVFLNAQSINTISYVPVKNGYYDKITTKSVTILAQDIGNVSMDTLKANSSKFTLETRKLTFGKPVVVKTSVFTNGAVVLAAKNRVAIDGVAQANGIVAANKSTGAVAVQATNINMPTRRLDVGADTVYVDGIPIPNPNCTLEWKSITAKNPMGVESTYQLLGCHGTSGGGGGGGGGNVNVSTRQVNILVTYNFEETLRDSNICYGRAIDGKCVSISSKTYYDGGSLGYVASTMTGPSMCMMGAEGEDGYFSGWSGGTAISAPAACPSGTNQTICASKCTTPGCRYECLLSESYPSSSSPYYQRRCLGGGNGGCEQDYALDCNADQGTATILTCSK